MRNVIVLGAAGRDFHNFLTFYKDNPNYKVVCFTATQIPGIERRIFPPELAGRKRYPNGIPIFPENKLSELIKKFKADEVVFSYSDISHLDVMHKASIVLANGASFTLLGPNDTMLHSKKPVIAVCATRTGAGKSPAVRRISRILRDLGWLVAIIRHPMPYGNLTKQAVQEFTSIEDLERQNLTIEEREEYEAHIANGFKVYAGVDYAKILEIAEKTADVIIFDGGNNDFPFIRHDLLFVVADARRPGHELAYHPGETNIRMADYVVVNKVDAATTDAVDQIISNVRVLNPKAEILFSKLRVFVRENSKVIKGKRVLCVEDGPTLTHGGLSTGVAFKVAQEYGARTIVDPREYAVGSLKKVFEIYNHLRNVLPAMGYDRKQIKDLENTINGTKCDLVIVGTPVDLRRFMQINKPSIRVTYELEEVGKPTLKEILEKSPKLHKSARSAKSFKEVNLG